MESEFSVTPVVRDGYCLLVLEGELDAAEAPKLTDALQSTDGLPVIVDLTALTFIDSSGLHVLLRDRGEDKPDALVYAPGSNVARVLDIVEARKAIPLYDDVTAAVERLRAAS